jgi:hypothetical protein
MSKLRPGVDAGKRLFTCADLKVWLSVEEKHQQTLLDRIKDLKDIDQRYRSLGELLSQESKTYITQDELLLVVRWKFLVGKPRQALMKHLHSNTQLSVQEHSTAAIQFARSISPPKNTPKEDFTETRDTIKKALEALMNLKGVGPATASAVLSLVRPDCFAYMYDEAIESCGLKRTYNLSTYISVNGHCQNIANKLNGNNDNNERWTTSRVARALWIASRAKASGLQDYTEFVSRDKLKRVDHGQCQDTKQGPKRQKRSRV